MHGGFPFTGAPGPLSTLTPLLQRLVLAYRECGNGNGNLYAVVFCLGLAMDGMCLTYPVSHNLGKVLSVLVGGCLVSRARGDRLMNF